jgi:uncharacterized protein
MVVLIEEVRARSGGEIAVVTLPDLGGRASIEVARDIGRQWGVGARGGPGDRARNAGLVLLLKPGARPGDGRAEIAIATGGGVEGFITDARAGRIRDAIGRVAVERGSYAAGLVHGVQLVAQAYAEEFGFRLSGVPRPVGQTRVVWTGVWLFFGTLLIWGMVTGIRMIQADDRQVRDVVKKYRRYERGRFGQSWIDRVTDKRVGWVPDIAEPGRQGEGRGIFGSAWLTTVTGGGGDDSSWSGGGFGGGFGGFGGGGGFSGGGASGVF